MLTRDDHKKYRKTREVILKFEPQCLVSTKPTYKTQTDQASLHTRIIQNQRMEKEENFNDTTQ